jgi:cytochrome c biogenesis protein ResB
VSPRLAIALLVVVLACCVIGVTVVRGVRAGQLIFGTLWFNGLLVLLAVSSAAAFFTRIWKRKLTLVSAGMILFHLSFVALLGGIVYNRLFHFRGVMRLTEGETLANGQPESYDEVEAGRFFNPARLRGATTLVRMHANYSVDGGNKRAAYELAVGDAVPRPHKIIYVTEYLDYDGVRFFCLKEGYSVLVIMNEKDGHEVFGIHLPLQSYRQADGTFRYATGSAKEEMTLGFPTSPQQARADIHLAYRPSSVKEREGEVTFRVRPIGADPHGATTERTGFVAIGSRFDAGDFFLTPREIRYWVGMDVRYDPGLSFILGSLCFALLGMVLTFAGRLRQGAARKTAASPAGRSAEPAVAAYEEAS